jgi:hypothetical protein
MIVNWDFVLKLQTKNEGDLIWDSFVPFVKEDLMKIVCKKH